MSVLCLDPLQQFFDDDGNPLAGGKLYTYDAVTLDERAVYTDTDGATPHENPIELDASGRPPSPIFYTRGVAYNLILKDADDETLDTNVSFEVPTDPDAASTTQFEVVFFKGGTPTAGELIYAEALASDVDFSANFAGSVAVSPSVPPAAEFVVSIKVNGTTVGTATCSTLGVWTFATTGAATVSAVTGDEVKFVAQASVGTIEDIGLTLVGTVA